MSHVDSSERFLLSAEGTRPVAPSFDMQSDFFGALSSGDIDRAASVFAADGTLLFPGLRPVQGRALVKRILTAIRRRYDDIEWRPAGPTLAMDGWVVSNWKVRGTFKTTLVPYDNEVLSLVRLDADGRVAMLSDYFKDTLAFHPSHSIPAATVAPIPLAPAIRTADPSLA